MSPLTTAYASLGAAIILEVSGSAMLQKSEQFTRLGPTALMAVFYVASMYLLSLALRSIPLGVAYAIWAGLGVVLTAAISAVFFKHPLDMAAYVGIGFILVGVMILNGFSNSVAH